MKKQATSKSKSAWGSAKMNKTMIQVGTKGRHMGLNEKNHMILFQS